jgi:hypothetical protein
MMKPNGTDINSASQTGPGREGREQAREWVSTLEAELREGLELYWQSANRILSGSGVRLASPVTEYFALERNFFSALFLYSYFRAQISAAHRVLYVAVNQCLRGMVTGCDNLLDDEYKMTLDTDLPATGTRFRSVMDIMVSDRILFDILLDHERSVGLTVDRIQQASWASLRALTRSGIQEASEEKGIEAERLHPEEILSKIHHYKTGLLFQCTWAVPDILEGERSATAELMKDALYRIGIGCQIMDDMVDLMRDVRARRHNYVASLVHHGANGRARKGLSDAAAASDSPIAFFSAHPELLREAYAAASSHLENGLSHLFTDEHQCLVEWAAGFIGDRIGVNGVLAADSGE